MNKSYRTIGSLLTVACAVMLCMTARASAEEAVYVGGKYIIETASSELLTKKSIEQLETYTNEAIIVEEMHKHITVVSTLSEKEEFVYKNNLRTSLCVKARLGKRKAIGKNRRSSTARRFIPCEQDQLVFSSRAPNDSYYMLQWGFKNNVEGYDMRMESAWDKTTGSRDTVVGIIDSGVDYNHPDLQANLWRNPGEIPGNGIDDDHNGVIDDVYGYNAITGSGDPLDDHGHGTHVAGTIGAVSNNSNGVAGVNWQVQIVAIKFLSSTGSGYLSDAVKAIDYATGLKLRGINIIGTNNSWGGGGYSQALYDAIERANTAGLLFVAAAGNSAQNIDQNPSYPAGYANTNIISVAALARNGTLAGFSNYGAQNVDVAAPGVTIASTYPGNSYVYMDGTSMASPHVTGLLALAKSYAPNSTANDLKTALFNSITPISGLNGYMKYPGLVNASAMLDLLAAHPPATVTPLPPTATPTRTPVPATPTPSPTPTITPTPIPGYYTAKISVLDTQGSPLAGAFIEFRCDNGRSYFSTTGDNGLASMNQILGPTNYTVIVKKAGSTFQNLQGRIVSNINLTAQSSSVQLYALKVHVVHTDQTPLAGLTVNFGSSGTLQTDSSGMATLMLPVGTMYSLSVDSSQHDFQYSFATGQLLGQTQRLFIAKN